MTIYDWDLNHTGYYKDEKNNLILFHPLHNKNEGAMETVFINGRKLGGTYNAKVENGKFYLGYDNNYELFELTEKGFVLISSELKRKEFIRVVI